METINATEAKNLFGEVLIKAQQMPIGINRNGKPIAVILSLSEYEGYQQERLKIALNKGMEDIKENRVIDGITVINKLRKKVIDAKL